MVVRNTVVRAMMKVNGKHPILPPPITVNTGVIVELSTWPSAVGHHCLGMEISLTTKDTAEIAHSKLYLRHTS